MIKFPLSKDIQIETEWAASKEDRSMTNVIALAKAIEHHIKFAVDTGQHLHYYHDGVYHPDGDRMVEELYVRWLMAWDRLEEWNDMKGVKIAKYIRVSAPILHEKPPMGTINLLNGLYDWETGTLREHDPSYLSTVQIPITFDPTAECPTWDKFLKDILPCKGGDDYLRQIIGMCLIPFTGLQKCIVLVGSGSNGKSTFLNALRRVVGPKNVSNVPLKTLTNPLERFAKAELVGKLINTFAEMPKKSIIDTSEFKPLVGEDSIRVENKHEKAYYYVPFCKLIFSCNEIVETEDETVGYKRRFINIPFSQKFKVDPKVGMELAENLILPSELSGLLNRILPTIHRTVEEGLYMTSEVASMIDDWCIVPDSVEAWIRDRITEDEGGYVPMEAFYSYYAEYGPADDIPREHAKAVRYIRHLFPSVTANVRLKQGDKSFPCYKGIRLKDRELGAQMFADSRHEELSLQ